jgi:hypothetical protein
VFPTHCWYCGQLIWLFADPFGGFAIFDELGSPWPKHQCHGVTQDRLRYVLTSFRKHPHGYRLPVPDVEHERPANSVPIRAVVINPDGPRGTVELYNGSKIYPVRPIPAPTQRLREGDYIVGCLVPRTAGTELHDWALCAVEPPGLQQVPPANPAEVRNIVEAVEELHDLKIDAAALARSHSRESDLLGLAHQALVSGYQFTGMVLLCGFICAKTDQLPVVVKARHAALAFEHLQAMELEAIAPGLSAKLSHDVRASLGTSADNVINLGKLKIRTESPERIKDKLRTRLRKPRESRFREGLQKLMPEGMKFESLLTMVIGLAKLSAPKGGR